MDASTGLSVVSLTVSAAALLVSIVVSLRQLRLSRNSNHLPVVIETFRESRAPEFSASVEYTLYRLAQDHTPDSGYLDLPEETKTHLRRVGLFLDDLGKLVAHGVADQGLILGAYGDFAMRAWNAMGPFLIAEEQLRGVRPMPYFEHLVVQARSRPRQKIHRRIKLERTHETDIPGEEDRTGLASDDK